MRIRYAVPAALLAFALGACTGEDDQPGGAASPEPSASVGTPTPSDTATPTPSEPDVSGGTAEDPAVVTATTDLLAWKALPGSVDDTVTTNGEWTLTVKQSGTQVELEGPNSSSGTETTGEQITDAFLDEDYAVVVFQDRQEIHPSRAEVTDLETSKTFSIDGDSEVPTTTGGTWALGDGTVVHATINDQGSYCLASVDLETRASTLGWCAPKRQGFNGAHVTDAGWTLQTFDDSRPSCRTLVSTSGREVEPLPGVLECKGWDAALIDDGPVWSVVPKDNQVESAHFYASTEGGYFDLGPGTSGTLEPCADAAYFVRDPQHDGDPARLLRWNVADGLTIAYESPGGQAFLAAPRCGGDTMNVTALAESGDEQVSADLG